MRNKKSLTFLGLGCSILLLTACGGGEVNNTLSCTADMSDDLGSVGTMKAEVDMKFNDENTEITRTTMKLIVEVNEYIDESLVSVFEESIQGTCDTEGKNYESCEIKRDGKKITLTAVGDPSKMDELGDISKDGSVEEIKKILKNEGFTCK